MRQNSKVEGTKIAQAAKDLNVTSVTIRRYLIEFNIPTTADENGIKVLPSQAMEELKEVRRLKEDGLTNPKVLEFLEDLRSKNQGDEHGGKQDKSRAKKGKIVSGKEPVAREADEDEAPAAPVKKASEQRIADSKRKPTRKVSKTRDEDEEPAAKDQAAAEEGDVSQEPGLAEESFTGEEQGEEGSGETRSKHSLTCQTCGKVFEHMNPRLRDCLDCYRTKRKERRRGGSDRHKNVIQHPLAQQVASKSSSQQNVHQQQQAQAPAAEPVLTPAREHFAAARMAPPPIPAAAPLIPAAPAFQAPVIQRGAVRNYRKAIEETRQVTGSLKRRLERPDLPEGERRWLEQIYAYQLILHQGWRHLAEYKAATQQQGRGDE